MYVTSSVLKNSNFSFLTCYRDACGYITKDWIVDDAINAPTGLLDVYFYGYSIVKLG